MKYKSMFPWMILDMSLFILINWLILSHFNVHIDILKLVSPTKVVILGLAIYRAANIISNEFIATPIRAYFVQTVEKDGKEVEYPYEEGFRGFFGSLIYCPSCTGVWISMILTYIYLIWPGIGSVIILILAVSGLERFFAYSFGKLKRK